MSTKQLKSHQQTEHDLRELANQMNLGEYEAEAAVASALCGGLRSLRLSMAAENILRAGITAEDLTWIARDITAGGGTPFAAGWVWEWINNEARAQAEATR